ncbi:MAG: hypothetical protein H7145_13200 [Akkermansiaceae bacterium]|nr:hypothetical protein [Armatimonadota bacterium]
MNVTKITYGRSEQRSLGFQNAGTSMTIEIEVAEGESTMEAYERAKNFVDGRVVADACAAVEAAKAWREQKDAEEAAATRARNEAAVAAARAARGDTR